MSDILFRRRDLLGSNPSQSRAMKKLLENKEIAGVLNSDREIRQFRDALRKYSASDRYITGDEVRAVLADLKYGTNDAFTQKEVRQLRKGLDMTKPIERSDLAQDSRFRRSSGGVMSTDESNVSRSKRLSMRGLPF